MRSLTKIVENALIRPLQLYMLVEIADKIIDGPQIDADRAISEELRNLLDRLFIYLDRQTYGAISNSLAQTPDTETPYGRILSMPHAASCLTDHERTVVFARGLFAAIQKLKSHFPGERLEVCMPEPGHLPLSLFAF